MWQERAVLLNERPVYGRLQRLPNGMKDSNYLKECIRLDYVRVWKIFKNMVQRGARDKIDDSKNIRLPPEEPFVLKLQSYRGKIVLGALLLDCFTGMPPSRSRIQSFVLHKSDNTILLHIPSQEQVRELFLIGNLNAAEFESKNNLLFSMSGKMHIKYNNNNKPDVAYIIKQEGRNKLHILTESKCLGTCSKPKYCKDSNVYAVDLVLDGEVKSRGRTKKFTIEEYHPIRIQLSIHRAEMRITTSRLVYKKLNTVIRIQTPRCT